MRSQNKPRVWYEDINKLVDERNNRCKVSGVSHVYNRDNLVADPYEYKNVEEFKKENEYGAFHKMNTSTRTKRCIHNNNVGLNKLKNSLPGVVDGDQCKAQQPNKVKGVWDGNTISRVDKYSKGVCWKDQVDQKCGSHMENIYLISKDEFPKEVRDSARQISRANCERDTSCEFVKFQRGYDCIDKNKAPHNKDKQNKKNAEHMGPVSKPPKDMPSDPTDVNANIQDYLFEWYTNKKVGNKPPAVGALDKAVGNQCVKAAKETDKDAGKDPKGKKVPIVFDQTTFYKKGDLKKMRFPLSRNDRKVLIRALGIKRVEAIEKSPDPRKSDAWDTRELYRTVYNEDLYIEPIPPPPKEDPTLMKPSLPQSVMNMIFKKIAHDPTSAAKGMLALHSTGSGKTFTAAGIMDAFWNTNRCIYFVSSIDAIAANPPFKFHEGLKNLFPDFQKKELSEIETAFQERGVTFLSFAKMANRIKKTQALFAALDSSGGNKKVSSKSDDSASAASARKSRSKKSDDVSGGGAYISHPIRKPALQVGGKFSNKHVEYLVNMYGYSKEKILPALKSANIKSWDDFIDLDNAIVIVDEVHNLFRPLATQRGEHNYLESHFVGEKMKDVPNTYKNHTFKHDNMKIVILSATPGDSPTDILKLLNIVRNPFKPVLQPFDVDRVDAIEKFKQELTGLISYFDMSNDPGKFPRLLDPGPIRLPMSNKQLTKYIEAYKENAKQVTTTDYGKLAKSNQLNKYWNKARKYSNMLYTIEDGSDISDYSAKMPALLDKIEEYKDDKHYVYSAFYENKGTSHGVLQIERELKKKGYEKLTIAQAKAANKGVKLDERPRYILATLKDIGDSVSAGKNLAELIQVYNSVPNNEGKLVHVMIASNSFNEGIDLKAVRHIHIFEPLVTMASDKQTIGRARRYCSHASLDYDKWSVMVHRYMTDIPISMEVDNIASINASLAAQDEKLASLTEQNKNSSTGRKASPEEKALNAMIKSEIVFVKKTITDLKKTLREQTKNNVADIKNIDEKIYTEAKQRMKQLTIYYKCMKEAAVDCKLLEEFHNDPSFRCGFR